MMKQFDHMIERKLNLELSNVFPRLSNVFPRLKFLAGCGQFSDFSNNEIKHAGKITITIYKLFLKGFHSKRTNVNRVCGPH
jgi:hypothetical protein